MNRTAWLIALGGVIVAVVVGLVLLLRPSPPQASAEQAALTAEQRAYLPAIGFSDAKMSAAENYLGQTIFYLSAKVTNKGAKPVQWLDVELEFHDVFDQVVLRDTAHAIRKGSPPLKAGEARTFVVAFEHLPAEWNQAPPAITPKYVSF